MPPEPLETDGQRWKARPVLAALVIVGLYAIPLGFSLLAVVVVSRLDVLAGHRWLTVLLLGATALTVSMLLERAVRRLLPLAALLRLTMLFPDRAPTRFKVARAASTSTRAKALDGSLADAAEAALTLMTALGAHDRRTRGHSERVRVFADMLAEQLNLVQADRDRLRWASLLHDIGKLEIPRTVLNKPAKLDNSEFALMKTHPEVGAELTATLLPWLGEWSLGIVEHHEKYDGTGYPAGRAGVAISPAGRIIGLVDAFETMTAARAYKKAMATRAAREELARCAGTHFDPAYVRAFLGVSLPKLIWAMGPLSFLAQLPFLRVLAQSGARTVVAGEVASTVAGAAVIATVGVTGAYGGVPNKPVPRTAETAAEAGPIRPMLGPGLPKARAITVALPVAGPQAPVDPPSTPTAPVQGPTAEPAPPVQGPTIPLAPADVTPVAAPVVQGPTVPVAVPVPVVPTPVQVPVVPPPVQGPTVPPLVPSDVPTAAPTPAPTASDAPIPPVVGPTVPPVVAPTVPPVAGPTIPPVVGPTIPPVVVPPVPVIPSPAPVPPPVTPAVTPPSVSVAGLPAGPTYGDVTFTVSSNDPAATFTCALDGAAATACPATVTLTGLAAGTHSVTATATDAQTGSSSTTQTFTVAAAPTVQVDPAVVTGSDASVPFTGADATSFECSLDGGAWTTCTSPVTFSALAPGSHAVSVRGVGPAGPGAPSAGAPFTIAAAPTNTFQSAPSGSVLKGNQLFSMTPVPGAKYECQVDGGTPSTCANPGTFNLSLGTHTVSMQAVLGGSVVSSAATTYTVVDGTTTLTAAPPAATTDGVGTFAFMAAPGLTFQCAIGAGGFTPCTSPISYVVPPGTQTFRVRAVDSQGATGRALTYTWTVL